MGRGGSPKENQGAGTKSRSVGMADTNVDYPRKIPVPPNECGSICKNHVTLVIHTFPEPENIPGICLIK